MSTNTAPIEALTVNALFDLTHTAAAPLLSAVTYPWEVLDDLGAFILRLGESLPADVLAACKECNVTVRCGDDRIATGRKKLGAMLGDRAEIGCGSVLNPGAVIGRGSSVYPLSAVRGTVPAGSIYKAQGEVCLRGPMHD